MRWPPKLSLKLIGAVLALVLVLGLLIRIAVLTHRARVLAFRADSLEAVADTTKKVAGAWELRATQYALRASELDDSLRAKPKVVFRTVVKFRAVEVAVQSPVTSDLLDSVRHAVFPVDSAPLRGTVTADVPRAPGPGRLSLRLGIDPMPIIPRVSCSRELFNGIHRAFVALDSMPPWARAEIRDARADPGVCNPPAFSVGFRLPWWTELLAAGGGFLAGWALHKASP